MLMIANKHTYNLVIVLTTKLDFFPITPSYEKFVSISMLEKIARGG